MKIGRGLAVILVCLSLTGPLFAGAEKRLRRALDWPRAELTNYRRVFVEDCAVTDPEAAERKIQDLVETVPGRMADYIGYAIDRELFPEVERRSPKKGESGVVLRVELTRYKPGSQVARSLLIGTSSALLDLSVRLLDAESGELLQSFTEERSFNWGGALGARSITLMEERAAVELAAYLALSRGKEPDAVLADLRMPFEGDGPPDGPHATIHIMRPQGMVGAASRFRVGVDEVTAGESKRNTYHTIYVTPGEHRVWFGGDKKKKYNTKTFEPGKTYYFQAMGLKEIPEAKALKKLGDCRLVRTLDLTGAP